jgi:hypothetical protein
MLEPSGTPEEVPGPGTPAGPGVVPTGDSGKSAGQTTEPANGGGTGTGETTDGAAVKPPSGTGKGRSYDGWVTLIGALLFTVFSFLSSLEGMSPTKKALIFVGIIAALSVAILAGLAWFYRKRPQVAGVTNFATLALVTLAFSLAPIVLLSANARTLGLQLMGILFLALFPGWLYLQFIAVRGKSLWDEYVVNLYRLDADDHGLLPEPPKTSMFHASWEEARRRGASLATGTGTGSPGLYERKFQGLYGVAPGSDPWSIGSGSGGDRREARVHGENLIPVVVLTLLLAVAWAMVLQPSVVLSVDAGLLPKGFAASSGHPLLPDLPLRFAFAGAYFFVLQMLVRRYFNDDLKTSAYINATVRIIITGLLVATLDRAWPVGWDRTELALAFFIGIFPQLGIQVLRAAIAVPLRGLVPTLKQRYPLSLLDGMNIWHESRLLEEGIEDIQNLATANLVDVMLRTRIPVDRLVDWIDQSHLYLHLWPEEGEDDLEKSKSRITLRRHGVRSATDLENLFSPSDRHGKKEGFADDYRWLLNEKKEPPSTTKAIYVAFKDEPNLHHVRSWKAYAFVRTRDEVDEAKQYVAQLRKESAQPAT